MGGTMDRQRMWWNRKVIYKYFKEFLNEYLIGDRFVSKRKRLK